MIRPSIVFLLVVLSAALSVGWGYKGHMVVGFIADEHLTPEARQEMASFCRAPSTAYLANWADAIREDRPETAPWHYVNLPDGADGFVATRDVPDEGCVVDRIDHFRAILADDEAAPELRRDALRWVVHLVGDLHQPLHCSREEDRGGNGIIVRYAGGETNLHSFWDTDLVEVQGLSPGAYAEELLADIRPADRKLWAEGQPGDWATESWHLANGMAYRNERGEVIESGDRVGRAYVSSRTPIVDERLKKAGVRLAMILNDALGTDR